MPTVDEQPERLKNVSLDQVRSLYRDYLGADHGEVVVVGDFLASEILQIPRGRLKAGGPASPYAWIGRPYQTDIEPRRETVSTPDKENAIYLAGQIIPIRDDDPDYPALLMGNFVLGGGALPHASPIAFDKKGGFPTPPCRCCRPTRLIVAEFHGHGDL